LAVIVRSPENQVTVYTVEPVADARWDDLLLHHPRANVFHTRGWLSALKETYDYTPIVFTTSGPGEALENAVVFCEVTSWITGRRLISLPFSDHCDRLADSASERAAILTDIREHIGRNRCKYAEIRPLAAEEPQEPVARDLRPSENFCLHMLSLEPPLEALFRGLHKDCIQRKVRRAEREGLGYEKGNSETLLRKFYQLLLRTRRRQGLPPQPLRWFRNLIASMGEQLTIRVASKDDRPVAAILTLSFKNTVTYKYGCSDERFSHLGGTPFLFWKTIQEAKTQGMSRLDLGRSELDNAGLIKFKDRLGATRTELKYYRLVPSKALSAERRATASGKALGAWRTSIAHGAKRIAAAQLIRRIVRHLPDPLLVAAGRLLYRHFG
jgi:hypothetical protein